LVPKSCIDFERGIAMYDYTSKNDDELNFKVGDEIIVLNKETGENGWYQGFNKGLIGFFPSNYIKLVHLDYISTEETVVDEDQNFPFSHQESEYSSVSLEYNLFKNEQNSKNNISKGTNISEEIDNSSASDTQKLSKPNISNFVFSSKMYINNYSEIMDKTNNNKEIKNKNSNDTNYNNNANENITTISFITNNNNNSNNNNNNNNNYNINKNINTNGNINNTTNTNINTDSNNNNSANITTISTTTITNNKNNNNKDSSNNNDNIIKKNNNYHLNNSSNKSVNFINDNDLNNINSHQNEEILKSLINIQNETVSLNFNANINSLQTDIYFIIRKLNKYIEDIIIEEYKLPISMNQDFNNKNLKVLNYINDDGVHLSGNIYDKENIELKKRQGMINDESFTIINNIDNNHIDEYYHNICGSPLKARVSDVKEVDGYLEELEKGVNPNNSILDLGKIDDVNEININNVPLSNIIDEKDIVDNKINIEVVLLKNIENFVDNARELIDVEPHTSDYIFILRNCIDYLNKIADATKIMIFTIKCKQSKSKLLMACKNVASSLAAVINSSRISREVMYQQSQELIYSLTHFIELINKNSGRYKEEIWNNVKSQIEEDRITLHSSLSNTKDENSSQYSHTNNNTTHFEDSSSVHSIHTYNSNANAKNPIFEEILQNEFEILNSQVKEISPEDDSYDDEDIDTLDRLYSNMNYGSNINTNTNFLTNKNKKSLNKDIINNNRSNLLNDKNQKSMNKDVNKSNSNINKNIINKYFTKKIKVVSSKVNRNKDENKNDNINNYTLNEKNKDSINHYFDGGDNNTILSNDSVQDEKKYNSNYNVVSLPSKKMLLNKRNSQNLDNSENDSHSNDLSQFSQISQIINSYSNVNISSNGLNCNNDNINTTTNNNMIIGHSHKNNIIQLEHILSPNCQISEIKNNEAGIFNSNKNIITSEINNSNEYKDLNAFNQDTIGINNLLFIKKKKKKKKKNNKKKKIKKKNKKKFKKK